MRSRSITGPILLVVIGLMFLINNVWRDIPFWSLAWQYWPLLLIVIGVIGLVEALYHASRGVANPPRPLAGAGIFWVVMAFAFFSWAGNNRNIHIGPFSNGFNFLGTDYDYTVSETSSAEGVTRIVLDNVRGNLSLKGQDGGDVKITGRKTIKAFSRTEADKADKQTPLHIDRQGDQLIIRTGEPSNTTSLSANADLDITIPKGVDIETRGRNGEFTADDISGAVTVTSGRGDIRLSNIGKDVRIDSSRRGLIHATDIKGKLDVMDSQGGDVQVENVQGAVNVHGEFGGTIEFRALAKPLHFWSEASDFRAEAVPGEMTFDGGDIKLANLTGPVRLRTGNRDITASDISNAFEVSIHRGDIEVTQTKTPLPKLDIHSTSGDITLAIPDAAAFDLDGRTGRGDVTNDFGDPLTTDKAGRAGTIRGKKGSGGPEIKIGTDRGSLTVKKN